MQFQRSQLGKKLRLSPCLYPRLVVAILYWLLHGISLLHDAYLVLLITKREYVGMGFNMCTISGLVDDTFAKSIAGAICPSWKRYDRKTKAKRNEDNSDSMRSRDK